MGDAERRSSEERRSWQVAVAMYAAGAITLVATLPAPDPDTSDRPAFMAIAALFAVIALALWWVGPRPWTGRVVVAIGLISVGCLVGVARPLGATPFFYLWPVLHAAYFNSRRDFVFAEVMLALTYGAALALFSPPGLRMTFWLAGVIVTAVAGGVVNHQRQQLEHLLGELRTSAGTDPLTGLMNRREFALAFGRELARARRAGRPLTLGIFDLDHFKAVNDRFGHLHGDAVLCVVADILADSMREGDVVARFGGEEFAVVFADTGLSDAHRIAERIGQTVAERTAADDAPLTLSAGLAERSDVTDSEDALFREADEALYEAKAAGRRRMASHDGEMTVTPV